MFHFKWNISKGHQFHRQTFSFLYIADNIVNTYYVVSYGKSLLGLYLRWSMDEPLKHKNVQYSLNVTRCTLELEGMLLFSPQKVCLSLVWCEHTLLSLYFNGRPCGILYYQPMELFSDVTWFCVFHDFLVIIKVMFMTLHIINSFINNTLSL